MPAVRRSLGGAPGPPSESRYVGSDGMDGAGEDGHRRPTALAPVGTPPCTTSCARPPRLHRDAQCASAHSSPDDDYWRAVSSIRIRHWLERHPEQINLTVRGRAFRLGMPPRAKTAGTRAARAAGSLEGSRQEPSDSDAEGLDRWKPPSSC